MNITYCYTREEGNYNVLLYAKAIRRHAHCFKRKQKPPCRKIFKSQKPKAIAISYIGGWAAAKASKRQKQKRRLVFSKAIFAKAKAAKAAKALLSKASKARQKRWLLPGIAGYCAAVLVVLRAVRRRQTVQFCAVALFSISSPPPCCRANKAHCKALQATR